MLGVLGQWLIQQPGHLLLVTIFTLVSWGLRRMTLLRKAPRADVFWLPAVLWLAYAGWEWLVRRYYKANLAVINIGDVFTTGPKEAAYVIDEMVKPREVILSHANEVATDGGKVLPGTRTETFVKTVKVPAHVPLSGKTMEFDGSGKCTAGC